MVVVPSPNWGTFDLQDLGWKSSHNLSALEKAIGHEFSELRKAYEWINRFILQKGNIILVQEWFDCLD